MEIRWILETGGRFWNCSFPSKVREAFYFITSYKTFDRDASDLSLFEWYRLFIDLLESMNIRWILEVGGRFLNCSIPEKFLSCFIVSDDDIKLDNCFEFI